MNFDNTLSRYKDYFENSLNEFLSNLNKNIPEVLRESISYAIKDGGKRVRPVLLYATAEMLGLPLEKVKNYALSIEMIHSYSLVHDDLPAMDNDDYRRGKLSTHKKFGEAHGILAGDALLNLAFETALLNAKDNLDINAVKQIGNCAGYNGMIKGQVLDLLSEKEKSNSEELLFDIYENKTSKLLIAPLTVASILSNNAYYNELYQFGYNLGILFQITDDIMDYTGDYSVIGKTPHKDEKENKFTSVKIFGINGAKQKAKEFYEKSKNCIADIPNSKFLSEFTDKLYLRKS